MGPGGHQTDSTGPVGGVGFYTGIRGPVECFGAGGGGGNHGGTAGKAGCANAGNGGRSCSQGKAAPHHGGGGGGQHANCPSNNANDWKSENDGGSGIVVVRYPPICEGLVEFTQIGDSSWKVPDCVTAVEVLVLGGGGGGGRAGGGGGGGVVHETNYKVTAGKTISIKVGKGGDGHTGDQMGNQARRTGGDSQFAKLVALGGGTGGWSSSDGFNGGSGGGSGFNSQGNGGLATQPKSTSGGMGHNGGGQKGKSTSGGGCTNCGAGGGGAGGPGNHQTDGDGPDGGPGYHSYVSGKSVCYGAGGGGSPHAGTAGQGGCQNAGVGGKTCSQPPAKPGYGGGGGGAHANCPSNGANDWSTSNDGGSGRVVVRYPPRCSKPKQNKMRQYSGDGTFTVPAGVDCLEVLVVGGGGGGGRAGGGGGGGVIHENKYSAFPGQKISIKVGKGGDGFTADSVSDGPRRTGKNSQFGELVALGGGYGGWHLNDGRPGGSGGGGGFNADGHLGGKGLQPLSASGGMGNPGGGNKGGTTGGGCTNCGAGGGGATGQGRHQTELTGPDGGPGYTTSIGGSSQCFGAGGGGGEHGGTPGDGGCNAGKGGRSCSAGKASDGYGGGGGGQHANCGGGGWSAANDGGRGVVIVRW